MACVIPALTYETFGMITLEAFARQTPVIARDIGPLPEVVNESGGGLLFRNDAELRQARRAPLFGRFAARRALPAVAMQHSSRSGLARPTWQDIST